jgi:hypothetical protein
MIEACNTFLIIIIIIIQHLKSMPFNRPCHERNISFRCTGLVVVRFILYLTRYFWSDITNRNVFHDLVTPKTNYSSTLKLDSMSL